ncbi:MAG: sigma-70 family RNA polymerase sigma factor [Isosphaeraceae bacterium]
MDHNASVTRLIQLLRADDRGVRDLAASLIWQHYFRDLLELARRNLDWRVRRRADEEDVLQSMFHSFCTRQRRGEFDLSSRDQLWKLLVTITLRKARNTARAHRQGRRDVARERDGLGATADDSCPGWALEQMDAAGPSPVEAAVLNEALERRLSSLEDSELCQIALRRLEGCTNREIGDQLGYTERSIERKLERIRSRWMSHSDGTP